MDSDGELRVGSVERQRALDLLADHFEAGRLDSHEYEDRRGRAGDAVTRGELDAVFTDLPGLEQRETDVAPAPGTGAGSPATTDRGKRKALVMGLAPFVALAGFFLTGTWLWFLLIPAAGVVMRYLDD
ncbi:MAG: DUF1707 domain-containing protein [Terracoccus sp.]